MVPLRPLPLRPWMRWHMHERQCRGVFFHLLSASQIYCLSFPSPHPQFISPLVLPTVSMVSHLLAYLSSPDTFACLPPPPVPQLFRRQTCSLSLPALDHVTLPLLSYSPSEVLYVRRSGACSPAHCLPFRICRRAYFNHRRPWSVESLQPWPRLLGKLCRTAGSGVSELYFQFHVGLKKTPMFKTL